MGHSEIGVTMNTYTHLGLDDAKNEMIRMEELNQARKEINETEYVQSGLRRNALDIMLEHFAIFRRYDYMRIKVNKIRCNKCGEIIESKSVHDFKFCKCGAVAVDGGKDYLRRCGNREDWEDLSEVIDDSRE